MITVTCTVILHRGEERIFITSPPVTTINSIFRKQPNIKWSATHQQWHLPLNQKDFAQLCKALETIATIDSSALKKFLQNKKALKDATLPATSTAPAHKNKSPNPITTPLPTAPVIPQPAKAISVAQIRIRPVNSHILPAFKQQLVLKAYSPSTIRTYLNEMAQFLQQLGQHAADDFTAQRIRDYLQYCFEVLHLKENTLHSRINSLKFYYEQVLKKEKFFWEVPRPKKPLQLPKLLNEQELARLFNSLQNKKHKAMLFTAYSAGLRVSEIAGLQLADIDSGRMQILIQHAKGKKDRYVNLSPVLLDILRDYLKTYRPRPRLYLFESDSTLTAYPTRTIQQLFSQAKFKAGISKAVGVHSLRHSFATHLLEKGTDIKYIKDILGHFNIRTTERYLHVANKQLVNILSPFDDLWKTNTVEW